MGVGRSYSLSCNARKSALGKFNSLKVIFSFVSPAQDRFVANHKGCADTGSRRTRMAASCGSRIPHLHLLSMSVADASLVVPSLRRPDKSRTTHFPPFGSGGRIRRFRNKMTGRRAAPKAAAKDYYAVKVGIISRISKLRAKLPTMAAGRRLSAPVVRSTCDRGRTRRKRFAGIRQQRDNQHVHGIRINRASPGRGNEARSSRRSIAAKGRHRKFFTTFVFR